MLGRGSGACPNPHLYDNSMTQGGAKVMCWAGILDDAILPLVWIDEGTSVNGEIYANVLQNNV